MADSCNYNIHVRGGKAECLMLYAAMPCDDSKDFLLAEGTEENFVLHFEGSCKWGLDAYCKEEFAGIIDVSKYRNVDLDSEDFDVYELEDDGLPYWYITMRKKSELLNVEILALAWSDEYYGVDHYKNGILLSSDGDGYDEDEGLPEIEFAF